MKLGQFTTQFRLRLIQKKLPLMVKVAAQILRNYLGWDKTSKLRSMVVMINTECNMRCEHCFAESFSNIKNREKLNLEELKAALKEMADEGVFHFALQGGEPFLYPHLDELIKAANPSGSYITLVSNGSVADKKRLQEVYELGVDKIALSIDSFVPEEHDSFRKFPGAHEKALHTLDVAGEIGLDTAVAITVTNDNLHTESIQGLINYCTSRNINVEINIPQPIGNWDGRTDLLLTRENFEYINELHKKDKRVRRDLYPHLGKAGCPAVTESLYMNVFGDIFPCVYMHIGIGNIRNHTLKDIRNRALAIKEFREYPDKCLAGEDMPFIEKYVSKGFGQEKPANGEEIFNLPAIPEREEIKQKC